MSTLSYSVRLLIGACSISLLLNAVVHAEAAPVYDVDSMGQPEYASQDQADIPPPPPEQQDGTFVPMQQQVTAQAQAPSQAMPSNGNISTASLSTGERLKRLEQQLNNLQNSEANARTDSLQNQVQTLRGQVEQLTHQMEQVQNQQKNLLAELKKTANPPATVKPINTLPQVINSSASNVKTGNITATIEAKANRKTTKDAEPAATAAAAQADDAGQPNVAEEQQIYQTAYNLIKAKKYNDAVGVLQNMLQKYPSGQFASNAHYWLGELYGLLSKNDLALREFSSVVKNYPDSPRVADAQLKVGLIYAAQFKWIDAKSSFKKVINHYPGTTSARLASEQLKEIKQAGH